MKFQDFDCIKDDDWSLTNPTFKTPQGGNLVVIGHSKIKGIKSYVVKCDLCTIDPELNGGGLFYMSKAHLLKGKIPCLCSKAAQVSREAMLVILQRLLDKKELTLLSDVSYMKVKVTTDLEIVCSRGHRYETNINRLKRDSGCQRCELDNLHKSIKVDDQIRINEFIDSGKFPIGSRFIPTAELNTGGNLVWKFHCPICSNDEYVKAGLCSGVFRTQQNNLSVGKRPCRCSSNFAWTKEQREYQINKRMKILNLGYTFAGWLYGYTGSQSSFRLQCDKHGISEINLHNFLNHKTVCPQCQGNTQIFTYINTVCDGDLPIAVKFGIANDVERRLKSQNSRNKFKMVNSFIYKFPDVNSCKSAERFCKKNLDCGIIAKADLFDGSSETTSINNIDQIKDIFVRFGGTLITS